jgi:hypothetical protein
MLEGFSLVFVVKNSDSGPNDQNISNEQRTDCLCLNSFLSAEYYTDTYVGSWYNLEYSLRNDYVHDQRSPRPR